MFSKIEVSAIFSLTPLLHPFFNLENTSVMI